MLARGSADSALPVPHEKLLLAASDAFVDQQPKIDPAVFGPSFCALIRCCRIRHTHRTRRGNVLYRNVTVLKQIGNDGLSALLAELLVVFKSASGVGIPPDFDHKPTVGERLSSQICDCLLILARDSRVADVKANG